MKGLRRNDDKPELQKLVSKKIKSNEYGEYRKKKAAST